MYKIAQFKHHFKAISFSFVLPGPLAPGSFPAVAGIKNNRFNDKPLLIRREVIQTSTVNNMRLNLTF